MRPAKTIAAWVKCYWRVFSKSFLALLVVLVSSISVYGNQREMAPIVPSDYQGDLQFLTKARIFFGHQSVGRNVLEGLVENSDQVKSPLRIVRADSASIDSLPGLFHADIGKNREPIRKIEAFTRFVLESRERNYDVVILKFCYDDLRHGGFDRAHALVEEYAKSVAAVRTTAPQLRLIRATIPLRADPLGWKTAIKRLLNRSTEEDADNQLRNVFNSELRKRFAGEAIFDIAEIESTLRQGQRSYFISGNDTIYTLAAIYTADGGHLNALGRQHVAADFIRVVAGTLRKGR